MNVWTFFILRLVLLLWLSFHCISLLPVNTTEQSFPLESSVYIIIVLLWYTDDWHVIHMSQCLFQMPFYKGKHINFDVLPAQLKIAVEHNSVAVKVMYNYYPDISMYFVAWLCHCWDLKKYDTFYQSLQLLDAQAFVDCSRQLHQANCPDDTCVNDRWSDDHVGTVVILCRSEAGGNQDPTANHQPRSGIRPARDLQRIISFHTMSRCIFPQLYFILQNAL